METFDNYGLAPEVAVVPSAFIALMALDVNGKSTHKAVWEAFALNRRLDRVSLTFKLLSEDGINLPALKQKRQSYEWYIPKGIIKSNWLPKYLHIVPSLVVYFYDLDWNDPDWMEKKNYLVERIHILKANLDVRGIRMALVLIQSGIAVPGEDTGAAEKAASLCTSCELQPKHLFVLPHSDAHLLGYTVRLETALSEIAWSFYANQAKIVRGHRDYLNKTNHQLLFVRHQFKLGFLTEIRSDNATAAKHYSQSYRHLVDLRFTDTNLHEIRTVAAIINYKICRLNFCLNLPRDAITQFRQHIDVFRQRTGPKELIFEHYAWLSKQYQMFGEVFEGAVQHGLPAVQTQHPGFYYQQAAEHAILRRKIAQQVCQNVGVVNSELLNGWSDLEFYGQRPWRSGKHTLEPPEPQGEAEGIKAVQHWEINRVSHASVIIPLFSSAINQFEKYRCPRIRRHLMVLMAEEYHQADDSAKALTLLSHVMWDYRNERWWTLLSAVTVLALQCALRTASVADYVALLLEVLGPKLDSSMERREAAFGNLLRILQGSPPIPLPNDSVESFDNNLWSDVFENCGGCVRVDLTGIASCVQVIASFGQDKVCLDEPVSVTVIIRNSFTETLPLKRVSVSIGGLSHDEQLMEMVSHGVLPAGQTWQGVLHVSVPAEDVGKLMKISQVEVLMGEDIGGLSVLMHWSGSGKDEVIDNLNVTSTPKEFANLNRDKFDQNPVINELEILPRKPKLLVAVEHDSPALVWEWLPVSFHIVSEENFTACNISTTFGLAVCSEQNFEQTTQVATQSGLFAESFGTEVSLQFADITKGDGQTHTFYVKCLTPSQRTFSYKVKYFVKFGDAECPCLHEETVMISSVVPFQVTVETQSLKFEHLSRIAAGECFLVVPRVQCSAPVSIVLTDSALALCNDVATLSDGAESQVSNVELSEGEEATDCFPLVASVLASNVAVTLGQYVLYWKRKSTSAPPVSVSVGLPSVVTERWPVWVAASVPPQGIVRVPLTLCYDVTNTSDQLLELTVTMTISDAFMFSGNKEMHLRILPSCTERLSYILFPLLAGQVKLPGLSLSLDSPQPVGCQTSLESLLTRILPSHIYIVPQKKDSTQTISESFSAITVSQ